jgi:hypothetical protein
LCFFETVRSQQYFDQTFVKKTINHVGKDGIRAVAADVGVESALVLGGIGDKLEKPNVEQRPKKQVDDVSASIQEC